MVPFFVGINRTHKQQCTLHNEDIDHANLNRTIGRNSGYMRMVFMETNVNKSIQTDGREKNAKHVCTAHTMMLRENELWLI